MRELIKQVLEEEVEEPLGAARSQRAAERRGYRHGAKSRRLVLRGGRCVWQSRLVPRYRRATPEVEQAVLGVYLLVLRGSRVRSVRRVVEICRARRESVRKWDGLVAPESLASGGARWGWN